MLEAQKDMGGKEGFALPDIAPSKYFLTDKKVVVIIEEIPEK